MNKMSFTSQAAGKLQHTVNPFLKSLFKPANFGWLVCHVPATINHLCMEKLLNRVFATQINEGEFDFLQQRKFQLELIDVEIFVVLSYWGERITCESISHQPHESDVTLSIATEDAISLVQQDIDPDTLFFQRKLKISGDTDLAHHIKNTMDTLDLNSLPGVLIKLMAFYKENILM